MGDAAMPDANGFENAVSAQYIDQALLEARDPGGMVGALRVFQALDIPQELHGGAGVLVRIQRAKQGQHRGARLVPDRDHPVVQAHRQRRQEGWRAQFGSTVDGRLAHMAVAIVQVVDEQVDRRAAADVEHPLPDPVVVALRRRRPGAGGGRGRRSAQQACDESGDHVCPRCWRIGNALILL